MFALQQTSGLEAFSCQGHKLVLCLRGIERGGGEGKNKRGEKKEGEEQGKSGGNKYEKSILMLR